MVSERSALSRCLLRSSSKYTGSKSADRCERNSENSLKNVVAVLLDLELEP